MDNLERRVDVLEQLPQRMTALEAQIVQLREEMRSGFSAIRTDFTRGDDENRQLMHSLHEDVLQRIAAGDEESQRLMRSLHADLLQRIDSGDDETRRLMRVLHEDLIQRIATLKEGHQS